MTSLRSVLLAGGGSAGHVSPLIATADELRRTDPGLQVTVLGTKEGLEARLVPARGYDLRTIPKVPLPRQMSVDLLRLPMALTEAVRATGRVIDQTQPQVIVGFGGYVSVPAYLAAWWRGIPIVIHEQNARAGLANRLGALFTKHVAITFPTTRLAHAQTVGMPLRAEISEMDRELLRPQALSHFGLADHRPTVLVTGGSLGAARLNGALTGAVPQLLARGVQVLHLTGAGKLTDPPPGADTPGGPRYVVAEYSDRMDLAYAAADLVVSRAGANTVCEVTTVGLPAVYVPLPIGNGEQRLNVEQVVNVGGGVVVADHQITSTWLREQLPALLEPAAAHRMAQSAAAVGSTAAAATLAGMIRRAAS